MSSTSADTSTELNAQSSTKSNAANGTNTSNVHRQGASRDLRPESPTTVVESLSSRDTEQGNDAEAKSLFARLKDAVNKNLFAMLKDAVYKGPLWPIDPIVPSLDQFRPGYGKVAAIQDLDGDFLVFRKFGWARNYVLLQLQDELAELEEELQNIDDGETDARKLLSRRDDLALSRPSPPQKQNANQTEQSLTQASQSGELQRPTSTRRTLVEQLRTKLEQYDNALLRLQSMQRMKKPTTRSQRNVNNMITDTESLVETEADWIHYTSDLIAPGWADEYGWLNTLFENTLSLLNAKITLKLFRTKHQRMKTGNDGLILLSAARLDNVLRICLTVAAALLLLIPVAILFRLQPTTPAEFRSSSNWQIGTIFAFTMLFSFSCSVFTKARRQEIYTVTAAYCAVLVVFLGNTTNALLGQSGS
ncbi:hypothetical protein MMC21_000648 [Puttea exsequens]|nr:hypothetical protein [Puttea exsequens]